MPYTIGEAARILHITPSALRYYDKEGLLPFVKRSNGGIRVFQEKDFTWLYVIECLKKSGLSIKDIKHYMDLSFKGDKTIDDRLAIFQKQREKVQSQIKELQDTLDILDYKCWYYETAKLAGTTAVPQGMSLDEIPKHLQKAKQSLNKIQHNDRSNP